jgi:hypothetical protein
MAKRLNSWTGRQLSYSGRITLINFVLASLPLYFFSFFKAPRCILDQLVRMQRNFLFYHFVVQIILLREILFEI